MRLMLFGAGGQLGTSLAAAFNKASIPCIPVSRAQCDFAIATRESLAHLLAEHSPTLIINAAAYAAVDDAEKEKPLATQVNTAVPGMLAELCRHQDIPLIHFSTDYVFDGARGAPYAEDALTNPINHYGITKRNGEQLILNSGAVAYIFRLQLLYQATGNSFFCRMRQLLQERESLRVAADQLSAPTSVEDVTEAVIRLLPNVAKASVPTGIYHLAAGGYTSRHGFTVAIRDAMRARGIAVKTHSIEPIVSEEFPSPAMRPKDVRLSTEKLAAHGIRLPHWRDGLNRVIAAL